MAAMSPAELISAWEDAYLAQGQTARVGRLFKGTIHNLNGVVQAFSMQSELFAMMFAKADTLLAEALESVQDDTARLKIAQTRELLQKRQRTLGQVEEKILRSQELLGGNDAVSQVSFEGSFVTTNSLITNIMSFFESHMFFKHKVQKKIAVDADISVGPHAFALSVVLANLVENSIQAMELNSGMEGFFALRCYAKDDKVLIEVEDNGIGVPEYIQESLFHEFVSATSGHHGLGLYQAKKILIDMGGEIKISSFENPTLFTVTLPMNLEKA